MAENYINKIKIGDDEFDIQASSIGNVSEVNLASGTKNGKVRINDKGNVSVESLSKNVNLEAEKNIQLKAKEDIIFDSKRRIQGGGGNEVHLKFEYDDWEQGSSNNLDDEKWAELKVEARNMDLRCKDHGGLALQPCGIDGNGNENKIKFESSRKVDANTEIPDDLRRNSTNYNYSDYYSNEGGKGVEFGTFNNEHTSLYTKDYRFNGDGKVYSVTRGTITNNSGKFDYPTQEDDFKDIPVDDAGIQGTYNSTSGKWEKSSSSDGKYLVESSWNSIIKTAHALNDQSWTNTNISGKGNLQITVADEVEWVATIDNGNAIVLKPDKQDPKRKYVGDGNVYQLDDNNFYTCQLKSNGDHHLNLEADSTIKLESGYDDIELTAKNDKIQMSAPVGSIQLETQKVDFSNTPEVSFMAKKINKKGVFEETNAVLTITSLNSLPKTIYETNDYIRITNDNLYTADNTTYIPQLIIGKTRVYKNSSATTDPVKDDVYFVKHGGATFLVEINSSLEAKKNPKICDTDHTILYTGADTVFQPNTNTTTGITLYTDSTAKTTATEGFYLVEEDNNTYIIYIDSNNERAEFIYRIDSTDPENPINLTSTSVLATEYIATGYDKITFGGDDQIQGTEKPVQPGNQLTFGTSSCNLNDIITLVNYFKNGDGQNMGPWNNNIIDDQGGLGK